MTRLLLLAVRRKGVLGDYVCIGAGWNGVRMALDGTLIRLAAGNGLRLAACIFYSIRLIVAIMCSNPDKAQAEETLQLPLVKIKKPRTSDRK
jgi:hypothetical protein